VEQVNDAGAHDGSALEVRGSACKPSLVSLAMPTISAALSRWMRGRPRLPLYAHAAVGGIACSDTMHVPASGSALDASIGHCVC
jgi:hypothetical protein